MRIGGTASKGASAWSLRVFLIGVKKTLLSGWLLLLVGLVIIACGQYLMEQRNALLLHSQNIIIWGIINRLDIPNLENVVSAFGLFLVGGLIWYFGVPLKYRITEQLPMERAGLKQIDWKYSAPRLAIIGLLFAFLLFQLGLHQYQTFFPLLWLALLIWLSLIFWTWDRRAQTDLAPGLNHTDIAWMLGLFAFSIIVCTYAIREIPVAILPDEDAFWETARAVAIGGFKPPFFDFGVFGFPVASSIYQGWVMRLFGITVFGWRFSSALAASAAVIPVYLVGREWFNRRTAVIAALVMVANPYFLIYARLGYNNAQALFPVALSIYFWAQSIKRSSLFYCWIASAIGMAGFYTYYAAWLGPLTILLGACFFWLTRKISFRWLVIDGAILLLAAGLVAGPRLAFSLSSPDREQLTSKLFETSFVNSFYGKVYYAPADLFDVLPPIQVGRIEIFYEPTLYGELLTRGFIRTLAALFDPFILTERFMTTGYAGVISPIFFLIGLVIALRGWKQIRFGISLLWLISGSTLLSALNAFPPQAAHAVVVIPIVALLAAFGIVSVADILTERMPAFVRLWPSRALMSAVTAAILVFGIRQYFVNMPKQHQPGFEDIASWVIWNYQSPSTIFYIQGANNLPRPAYTIDSKMAPDVYRIFNTAGFLDANFSPHDLKNLIAFFPEDPNGEISARLKQVAPNLSGLTTYRDANGGVLGFAMTNTRAQLVIQSTFAEGIQSILGTPVWALILLSLIASLIAAMWGMQSTRQRLKINKEGIL